ncbi:hypothetical protein Pstr01_30600 [Pseudomonas straminea]|nr:hypothetical protein Pstr01_30600 [Pseudomonas straminea]
MGHEWVIEETFGGQVGAVQVTARDALTADVQLTRHATGHQLLVLVEQVQAGVGDWFADVQAPFRPQPSGAGHHGSFSRPVVVHHGKAGITRELAQAVAADEQRAQRRVLQFTTEGVLGYRRGQEGHLQRLGLPPVEQGIQLFVADMCRWQVQGRPGAQRRPDFPGHGVETETRHAGGVATSAQVEGLAVPIHQIVEALVLDHHAFRLAGGAGGVDHVGQVTGIETRHLRIVLVGAPAWLVEQQQRCTHGWYALEQILLAEHHHRGAVAQEVGDALVRVRWIDRHVASAGLEHRQQANQGIQAATGEHRHALVRAYAQLDQAMGQAVGAGVQFAIAEGCFTHLGSHGVGAFEGLAFDTPVHGVQAFIGTARTGEVLQQLDTLVVRQDIEPSAACRGRLLQCIEHLLHGALQVQAGAQRVDARNRLRGKGKGFAQVVDAHHQRVVAALGGLQHFDALPQFTAAMLGRAVPVVEQRVEQRRRRGHAAATLRQSQRGMLVAHQRGQALVRGADRRHHVLGFQVQAQRQGVDEDAQGPLGGLGAQQAAHQHGAEDHALTPAQPRQHVPPAQVEQAGDTHPEATGLGPQAQAQRRIQGDTVLAGLFAVAAQILQVVGQSRLHDVAQHAAEERLMLGLTDAQQCLPDIVAKRHRRAQARPKALQAGMDFMTHHLQRTVVEGDMVVQQADLHPAIGGAAADQPQQRRLGQIQPW